MRGPKPFPQPACASEAVANALQQEFGMILSTPPATWLKVAVGVIHKLDTYGFAVRSHDG